MRRIAFAVLAGALLLTVAVPGRAGAAVIDPLYPFLQVLDLIQGSLKAQSIPGAEQSQPFGAHPGLMPDWNNDGVFGNSPDYAIENSPAPASGPYRFPCIALSDDITYETTEGECRPGDAAVDFRTGQAQKLRLVDSMGWAMQAAIFLPQGASDSEEKLPGVVIANGAQAPMQVFYMYTMTLAARGMIVLNFDFAGQGQSEDQFLNDFFRDFGSVKQCQPTRPCKEIQDVVRWFTGADIVRTPTENPGSRDPAYTPEGENPRNPVLDILDTSRIGLVGESMGSLSVTNYLWHLPTGQGYDGRPLPAIKAAIGLSGFGAASAVVPFQMQTSDLDIPGYNADNFGLGATDGPVGTKAYYDDLRGKGAGNGALELIVIESGSHGDHSNATRFGGFGTPHKIGAWAVSTSYASDWMRCYLTDDADACADSVSSKPSLSRAQPSEYDIDGPAGPAPSRCITIPDKATLEQLYTPDRFLLGVLGTPYYDCTP